MRRSFYGSTPIISISYSLHQPLQNRTIPLTFRNANICMCRYAFTSALSYSLFVGEWACPSRCTDPLHSHNHCKRTTRPRLAPPHLPPLSKVRCCRPIKFGRRPEGLQHLLRPFRFSDTSVNNPSVTVTENVILHQHIFYFNIKQY